MKEVITEEVIMKKIIMLVGVVTLLTSPTFAQAPAAVYGTGNIIFPGDPSAAAAAGAYGTGIFPGAADAFAYEPSPTGKRGWSVQECMQRFKSYDPGSGTYLGYDGHRHTCH
jgi:BA14K-like protein